MAGNRKLEIGAGTSRIPGFETCDIIPGCDYQCSATEVSSLGKFDHLYCCMVLEHLRPWEIPVALADWYKALNDGGILEVIVPDFKDNIVLSKNNLQEALRRLFGGSLTQNGPDDCPEQEHRWAFTDMSLKNYVFDAGFHIIECDASNGRIYIKAFK